MELINLKKELKKLGERSIIGIYGIRDHGLFNAPRWTHDHNATCLDEKGNLKWYFELERLTKIKHDNTLEKNWQNTPLKCVTNYNDHIIGNVTSFAGNSFVSQCNTFRVDCSPISENIDSPIVSARGSVTNDPLCTIPSYGVSHELAHAFSAVAFNGLSKFPVLLVHADGGASVSSFSAFLLTENEVKCIQADWSNVYSAMNFGFNDLFHEMLGQNDDERLATAGRLMGFAAHSKNNIDKELINWLNNNKWFRYHWNNNNDFYEKARNDYQWEGQLTDLKDPFIQKLAQSAQHYLEQDILTKLKILKEKTGVDTLYAGGGIFLNIHLNKHIEDAKIFNNFYVSPNTSDTGLSTGAAFFLSWLKTDNINQISPYIQYNDKYAKEEIIDDTTVEELAERLLRGQAFAFVNGLAEAGPRALGHRSILCIPTQEVARRVSMDIKRREWYRPVSPIGIKDYLTEFFTDDLSSNLLKYMLTLRKPNNLNDLWKGGVHVDGTCRLQVLDKIDNNNKFLIKLFEVLWQKKKIPFLINTSLNRSGEPIVNNANEAKIISKEIGLDGIIINGTPEWYTDKSFVYPGSIF